MLFGHDPMFWIAVALATAVKLFTSQYQSFLRAVATVMAAVFSAYFFTDPAINFLSLDPDVYKAAVAALLALTGEGIIRLVIGWSEKPTSFLDFLERWRKGK